MRRNHDSWGRYPGAAHAGVLTPAWPDALPRLDSLDASVLPYGLGRSYGDACLNDGGLLIDASRFDRFRGFDDESGILCCESGISLGEILRVTVPRGWFLPVVPGTKEVTVGGAIANDVHGKNHHREGTFGRFVRRFELLRSNGERLICAPETNPEIFAATIGGLGLTGLILWAELQLRRVAGPFIDQEKIRFGSLDEYFELSQVSDESHEYTVAWLDCLASGSQFGRGILIRGNHSRASASRSVVGRARLAVNFEPPGWLLSRPFMRSFNEVYYRAQVRRATASRVHYLSFFFPLDAVANWNLLYGRAGFLQYQCVAPFADGKQVIREVLERIVRSGGASFLAVLKTFGTVISPGMMSFPRAGFTLSLDIPFRGERTLALLDDVDRVIRDARGAIYPAKDARMAPETFRCSFPRASEFARYLDPCFSSSFWRRVTR